jgi:polysaccharide biosynthesis/export protein
LLAALLLTPAVAEYRVQQGDTIEIEVAGIPELKQRSTVQPDRAIAFPLVGAIGVEGLTPEQLRSAVQTQLAKKIYRARTKDGREILTVIQPDEVSAAIVAYRPVYVTGDVAKPGEQTFLPGMTIRQTLALAGGIDIGARFVKASRDPIALRSDYGLALADFATATAKIARITAELNGRAELGQLDFSNASLPSERLAEIEKSESALLEARMGEYERERNFLKSSLDQSDERISVVQKQQAEEEEGTRADTAELKRLVDLGQQGA